MLIYFSIVISGVVAALLVGWIIHSVLTPSPARKINEARQTDYRGSRGEPTAASTRYFAWTNLPQRAYFNTSKRIIFDLTPNSPLREAITRKEQRIFGISAYIPDKTTELEVRVETALSIGNSEAIKKQRYSAGKVHSFTWVMKFDLLGDNDVIFTVTCFNESERVGEPIIFTQTVSVYQTFGLGRRQIYAITIFTAVLAAVSTVTGILVDLMELAAQMVTTGTLPPAP